MRQDAASTINAGRHNITSKKAEKEYKQERIFKTLLPKIQTGIGRVD